MGDPPELRLVRFARAHHGLYRMADARALGLSDKQISGRVRRGLSERVGPGVFRVAGGPESPDQRILAAVWRSGGVASHRTAAGLHGILDRPPGRPEVTVGPSAAHVRDGITIHRSRDLERSQVVEIRRIPLTAPARTLVDLGQVIGTRSLEAAVHRALHLGLLRLEDLVREYRVLSRPGRRGIGPIGEVLVGLVPGMGPAESRLEVVIIGIIRDAGLPQPVRQFVVTVQGERFRLDLAYPQHRLFLEGDGFGVHGTRSAFEDDRRRQNLLVLAGWRPLRFTWRQTRDDPWSVATQVAQALDVRG